MMIFALILAGIGTFLIAFMLVAAIFSLITGRTFKMFRINRMSRRQSSNRLMMRQNDMIERTRMEQWTRSDYFEKK